MELWVHDDLPPSWLCRCGEEVPHRAQLAVRKKENRMKARLIGMMVKLLMETLDADLLKQFADTVLTFAETKVLGSASKIDDAIVLPLCNTIREAFNIPD